MYTYNAEVIRVIDGDTVQLRVDLGFRLSAVYKFRIKGLDTPEIYGVKKGSDEYIAGMAASEYAKELLAVGANVSIRSSLDPGIYGRYLATIYLHDKGFLVTFSQMMKDAGHHKEK